MAATPREIMTQTLKFENPERLPRDMWSLPWTETRFPETIEQIHRDYPLDMAGTGKVYKESPKMEGDWYKVGKYVDEWGVVFNNVQEGVHGEVKEPIVKAVTDLDAVQPPYEILPDDLAVARDTVNKKCAESDQFMIAGCNPRPWERYQFLRGTQDALMDVMIYPEETKAILNKIHEFYLKETKFWCSTDIDALRFMDDWGSQTQLLIPPPLWREFFKPLYKDYCDIVHGAGKFTLMHSDGYVSEIYEDIIEVGVDAFNSQLFCMDMEEIAAKAKGKITFWGEIDRQQVMCDKDPQVARDAVRKFAKHFYDPAGGVIIQFSFGPGANPDNPLAIMDEWEKVQAEAKK